VASIRLSCRPTHRTFVALAGLLSLLNETQAPELLGAEELPIVVVETDFASPLEAVPAAPERLESPKQLILRLLTEIHSSDSKQAEAARKRLGEFGLTPDQLKFASLLKHPDRAERLRLVDAISAAPDSLRSELLIELIHDPDRDVRIATINRLSARETSDPQITAQLIERSRTDRDPAILDRLQALLASPELMETPPFVTQVEFQKLQQLETVNLDPLFSNAEAANPSFEFPEGPFPDILKRPIESQLPPSELATADGSEFGPLLIPDIDPPRGFTGPSGIIPTERQEDSHFIPQPDRWRNGYARTDRYGVSYPWTVDYIGVEGHWWDPYNQNVLKGDYPIIGQHTFLNLQATSQTLFSYQQVPTPTTPFESTRSPDQEEFFGTPEQNFINQNLFLRAELFHGNQTAFKPLDWNIRFAPVFNMNELNVSELGLVNPDVRQGRSRFRDHSAFLQEYFVEAKLADLSPDYDFVSARAGSQLFNSDFRGFIFFDTNRGVRLFGSKYSNRHQFNLAYFDMVEKDTNSGLNTNNDRHQNVLVANYYIQDFVFPGYTFSTSFHMNHDQPSRKFDNNDFLVRPDPTGIFQPHRVEAYYFGFAGDGHMGRFNVSNAFYWVTGRDSLNPISGQPVDINAFMGALELSYDRDWARFRASLFWSSGDDDANDNEAEGFDSIMDNPVFAGGEFSYWQRQAIQLFGVRLVNDRSLVADLRSSKTQGQSNFVNPGLLLFNLGFDADITPKLRMITNANYLLFDETSVLQTYTFQREIDRKIGLDLSAGFEWRPFHNDNMIVLMGASALVPDEGFRDLYNQYNSGDAETLYAGFGELILTF